MMSNFDLNHAQSVSALVKKTVRSRSSRKPTLSLALTKALSKLFK